MSLFTVPFYWTRPLEPGETEEQMIALLGKQYRWQDRDWWVEEVRRDEHGQTVVRLQTPSEIPQRADFALEDYERGLVPKDYYR